MSAAEIDRINILQATLQAMKQAVDGLKTVDGLSIVPKAILVDGTTPPQCHTKSLACASTACANPIVVERTSEISEAEKYHMHITCVPKGDSASHLIAAASILAKVERDAIMRELHEQYPQYGFDAHKGYGTAAHREALAVHGLSPQHRRSFCRKFL